MKPKRFLLALFLLLALLLPFTSFASPDTPDLAPEAKSALLMEASTGEVLFEKNADQPLPPASVTKIMTLLLTMEALDEGKLSMEQKLSVSETAAGMGGSQVYLEPGEQMTVRELLKCVAVASANDAATVLAEAISGSVEGFVAAMNDRAAALGMKNSHFENPTGLDDGTVNHLLSARDIALMSRELLRHEEIFEFTTIWMDSIREGAFGLTNTNRLVRFYKGANGLKTGFTSGAGYCMSATAKRDGMQLIAVVMGAPTRDSRNKTASSMLDYGFAGYALYADPPEELERLPLRGGAMETVNGRCEGISLLLRRGQPAKVTVEKRLPEVLAAPLAAGNEIGEKVYHMEGVEIGRSPILLTEEAPRISFLEQLWRLLENFFPL